MALVTPKLDMSVTRHDLGYYPHFFIQIASIFGFLNFFTRPLGKDISSLFKQPLTVSAGGYFGDLVYKRWGVPGKKYLMIFCGIAQGLLSLGLGVYIDSHSHPSCKHTCFRVLFQTLTRSIVAVIIVLIVILAMANEAANGVNFSLVPHCNPCKSKSLIKTNIPFTTLLIQAPTVLW